MELVFLVIVFAVIVVMLNLKPTIKEKKRKMTDAARRSAEESAEEARRAARDEADRILRDSEKMTDEAVKAVLTIIS